MTDALTLRNVTKFYAKDRPAVDNISFDVRAGSFTALLGPNGSGKSTTLKICANMLEPTSGSVIICGKDLSDDPEDALSRIGCVIETPALYADRPVIETLRHTCRMMGMTRERASYEAIHVLDLVDMGKDGNLKYGKMSKGMKQRTVLAQALIGSPEILILDEPTSGLDPAGMSEIEAILERLHEDGTSILMSSHMLQEVNRLCDSFVFIRHGEMILSQSVNEYRSSLKTTFTINRDITARDMSVINRIDGFVSADASAHTIVFDTKDDDDTRAGILSALVSNGIPVCRMTEEDPLERLFTEGGAE